MTAPIHNTAPSRSQRLRQHIASLHDAIEDTAIAQELVRGTISRRAYLSLHRRLWHIHQMLDERFASAPQLRPFLDEEDLRAEALGRDLSHLNGELPRDCSLSQSDLEHIEAGAWTRTLGMLYVVKGSRFGAKILAPPLAQALCVEPEPGQGIDFYLEGAGKLPRQWRRFLSRLDSLSLSAAEERQLLQGAEDLMRGLLTVYRSPLAEKSG